MHVPSCDACLCLCLCYELSAHEGRMHVCQCTSTANYNSHKNIKRRPFTIFSKSHEVTAQCPRSARACACDAPAIAGRTADAAGLHVWRDALLGPPKMKRHATVRSGAEVMVALLNGQHGAQDLVTRLAPLGYEGPVRYFFPRQVVIQLPGHDLRTKTIRNRCLEGVARASSRHIYSVSCRPWSFLTA